MGELSPTSSLILQCSQRYFLFSSPDVSRPQWDFSISSNILSTPPARSPGSSQSPVPLSGPAWSLRWSPGRVTPSVLAPVLSVLSFPVASGVSTITSLEVILTLSLVPTPPLWPGMLTTSHSNYQPQAPVAAL